LEAVAVRDRWSRLTRLCLFAAFAVAASAILAGNARAAFAPAAPPADAISTADPTTTFSGSVAGTTPSGDACVDVFPDMVFPGTCSYFELDTVDSGLVEVSIRWPVAADPLLASNLDLYVYECLTPTRVMGVPVNPQPGPCTQIATSLRNSGTVEFAEFMAQAGAVYEIRVVPFFVILGETYEGCAGYGDGDPTSDPCGNVIPTEDEEPPPPIDFFAACTPDAGTARKLTAGGWISALIASEKANLAVNVDRKQPDDIKGKLNYDDHGTNMRLWSDAITCVTFNDTNQSAEVRGRGDFVENRGGRSQSQKACFRSLSDDNGKDGDQFDITVYALNPDGTCNVGGGPIYQNGPKTLGGGNVKYHL